MKLKKCSHVLSERVAERGKESPINLPNLTSLVCFPIIIVEKRRGRLEEMLSRRERGKCVFSSFLSMTGNTTGTIIKTAGAKEQSGLEGSRRRCHGDMGNHQIPYY